MAEPVVCWTARPWRPQRMPPTFVFRVTVQAGGGLTFGSAQPIAATSVLVQAGPEAVIVAHVAIGNAEPLLLDGGLSMGGTRSPRLCRVALSSAPLVRGVCRDVSSIELLRVGVHRRHALGPSSPSADLDRGPNASGATRLRVLFRDESEDTSVPSACVLLKPPDSVCLFPSRVCRPSSRSQWPSSKTAAARGPASPSR